MLFGTILVAASASSFAQMGGMTGSLSLNFSTMDVWRGLNLVDDSVLKGTVHVVMDDFSAFITGRMELTDTNSYPLEPDPSGKITAVRGGLFYSFDYDQEVGVTLGVLVHQFPGVGVPQTEEIYYGLDFGGPLNFMLEVMQDVEVVKGYYVRASVSHLFEGGIKRPDGGNQAVRLSAHIAYADDKFNSYYYGADSSTLADLGLTLSTDFMFSGATVTPYLAYTAFLDPDLVAGGPNRTNFYGGVKVGIRF
jgi:hypothetical protein